MRSRLKVVAVLLVATGCRPALRTTGAANEGETARAPSTSSTANDGQAAASTPADTRGEPDATVEVTVTVAGDATSPPPPPAPPVLDACDDEPFDSVSWQVVDAGHFRLHVLPDTAAQADAVDIIARREAAYAHIRARLALEDEPIIDVYLSPSRIAASAHGVGFGRAYPGLNRIEVIYTGATNSYESTRFGHELTHVLAYYLAPEMPTRVRFLDEGLAELLDQSGRDLHRAYAEQLIASDEGRTYLTRLEDSDTWGGNYGRAGSLVQYLDATYGDAAVADLIAQTSMAAGASCHPEFGCTRSGAELEAFLDRAFSSVLGVGWEQVRAGWETEVRAALDDGPYSVGATDAQEIRTLVAFTDLALGDDDASLYRATMEGFYCDWGGEPWREDIAERAVAAFGSTQSEVLAVYDTGAKNFPTALALVVRTETNGAVSLHPMHLEHFPVGWRVTWAPDWY